jgi:hypothetical protein
MKTIYITLGHITCKTCLGAENIQCKACFSGTYLDTSTNSCNTLCPANFYKDDISGWCQPCPANCLKC